MRQLHIALSLSIHKYKMEITTQRHNLECSTISKSTVLFSSGSQPTVLQIRKIGTGTEYSQEAFTALKYKQAIMTNLFPESINDVRLSNYHLSNIYNCPWTPILKCPPTKSKLNFLTTNATPSSNHHFN
jgi:hypothetical protein